MNNKQEKKNCMLAREEEEVVVTLRVEIRRKKKGENHIRMTAAVNGERCAYIRDLGVFCGGLRSISC